MVRRILTSLRAHTAHGAAGRPAGRLKFERKQKRKEREEKEDEAPVPREVRVKYFDELRHLVNTAIAGGRTKVLRRTRIRPACGRLTRTWPCPPT